MTRINDPVTEVFKPNLNVRYHKKVDPIKVGDPVKIIDYGSGYKGIVVRVRAIHDFSTKPYEVYHPEYFAETLRFNEKSVEKVDLPITPPLGDDTCPCGMCSGSEDEAAAQVNVCTGGRPGGRMYDEPFIMDEPALSASGVEAALPLPDLTPPKPSPKPVYMCYVEGASIPRVLHEDFAAAQVEAKRLSKLPNVVGKTVHILSTVESVTQPKPRTCEAWVNVYDTADGLRIGGVTSKNEQDAITRGKEVVRRDKKYLTTIKITYTEKT